MNISWRTGFRWSFSGGAGFMGQRFVPYSDPESWDVPRGRRRLLGGKSRMSLFFACHFLFSSCTLSPVGREGQVPSEGVERSSLCLDSSGPWLVVVRKFGEHVRRTDPCAGSVIDGSMIEGSESGQRR